jgi:hypothetical protein
MTDTPDHQSYVGRLQRVQRIARSAQYRSDPKLAVREVCEAMAELIAAIIDRETGQEPSAAGEAPKTPPA